MSGGRLVLALVVGLLAAAAGLNMVNLETTTVVINDPQYDIEDLDAPRLSGWGLRALANLVHTPPLSMIIPRTLMITNKFYLVAKLAAQTEAPAVMLPLRYPTPEERKAHEKLAQQAPNLQSLAPSPVTAPSFRFHSANDYVSAYRTGKTTPLKVAHAFIKAVEQSNAATPPLRAVTAINETDLLRQADASARRYAEGRQLGPLDGVPIVVKEEFHVYGYATTVGTKFLADVLGPVTSVNDEAVCVRRLRDAGALIAGKTNMHEIGVGTTGHNSHFQVPRNPYNVAHYTSGSSAGSGAAVASGLAPIAIGADGGGSIRLPAAANGVVGIKGTFGRVSEHRAFALAWSVGHAGPLAGSVYDAALAYQIMAGPDTHDEWTQIQPPVHLATIDQTQSVANVRIGVFEPWFNHADRDVVAACSKALDGLRKRGAVVVPFVFPNLGVLNMAHTLTILSEMASAMDPFMRNHTTDFAFDTMINLGLARSIMAHEYVSAQRLRGHFLDVMDEIFAKHHLDAIITPTSGMTIPEIPNDAVEKGESNLAVTARIMRFAQLANFLGLPAITVPFGYSSATSSDANLPLPIGVQVMANHWNEHVVFRLGGVLEELHRDMGLQPPVKGESSSLIFGPRKPSVFFDLLAHM